MEIQGYRDPNKYDAKPLIQSERHTQARASNNECILIRITKVNNN